MTVLSFSASSSSFMLSSSSTCSSSTKPPFYSSSKNVIKTPFVGLSVAPPQKLWLPTTTNLGFDNGSNPRRSFEVFSTKEIARVPLDQRWMFEDDEVDGPVCTPHTPFLSIHILGCSCFLIKCGKFKYFFTFILKFFELELWTQKAKL